MPIYKGMETYRWSEIPKKQLDALTTRQEIHSATMTIARFEVRKGAILPEHRHPNEQISTVEHGAIRFRIGGEEAILRSGESVRIPSNIPHSIEVLEDSVAVDTFSPPRDDWK